MRRRALVLTIALISVVSVSLFVVIEWFNNERQSSPEFFVGVEFAYGDVSDCKDLVDKVKNHTNLFVVGSPEISFNQTWLNATCDYVYDAACMHTLWGLWKADESSKKIWDDVNNLLERYGSRLDIVYSDPESDNAIKSRYNKLVFWNEPTTYHIRERFETTYKKQNSRFERKKYDPSLIVCVR